MKKTMINRHIAPHLKRLASQYPVVTITGPRQSGKTTLSKQCFPKYDYITLENLNHREYAQEDPVGFLDHHQAPIILDEIQRTPELFSFIQERVDQQQTAGQYILTGSQQFALNENISQSLAGRTALLKLLPFSYAEQYQTESHTALPSIEQVLQSGFYPRIMHDGLEPSEAYGFYIETYVQRDIRSLLNVRSLNDFQKFMKILSCYTGQVVNLTQLGNQVGIDQKTAKQWLSILEASYIVLLLQPHTRNYKKRVIKSPKLYFYDTGLACYLLDIHKPEHARQHPLKGALFENMVVADLIKNRFNQVQPSPYYFYRDQSGLEIDLIADFSTQVLPIEIKLTQTYRSHLMTGLDRYRKDNGMQERGFLVYGGDESFAVKGNQVVSFRELSQLSQER